MTGRLFSRQFFCSFLSSKSGSREESPIRSPQGHPSSHITAHRTVQLKGRNRQGERGRIPQFRQLRNASPLYSSRQRALAQKRIVPPSTYVGSGGGGIWDVFPYVIKGREGGGMEGHLAHEETRGRQKANSSFFLLPDRGEKKERNKRKGHKRRTWRENKAAKIPRGKRRGREPRIDFRRRIFATFVQQRV